MGSALLAHLQEDGKEKCEGKKILIFTQFATTARYIGEELKKHFKRAEHVSGGSGGVLEKAALFSPKTESNRKYLKKRGIEVTAKNEIDILVSTEVLGEGINLQDGQVIINYELHWNPVRIIQRVGRIDRIGSINPKIWVYNFFPQLEAELRIGIKAKIEKRIQEIQTRFGGDDKVISQDEKLVDKKFYEMYAEDARALEEHDIESVSQKQKVNWRRLKEKYPEEYKKALALPNLAHCGLSRNKRGVVVYCRAKDIYKLYLADKEGNVIDENDWQILSVLECDASTKAVSIYENHHEITETIRLVFQDRANEIENNRCGYLELLKRQVLDRIEKAKRSQNEDTKKWMSLVQGSVRLIKLDIKLSRELRGVIRKRHGLTPKEVVEKIETLLKDKEQINKEPARKLYSEIVLSESLM